MSLSDARRAWESKAATILDTRLRQRLAAAVGCPDTWADRLRVTVGHDSLDQSLGPQTLSRIPLVDLVPMVAEVVEHVESDELIVGYEVVATVDASDLPESEVGSWASWLAGAAVELLRTYGADPTDSGPAWMVRADALADTPEVLPLLQPYTMRARGSVTLAITAASVRSVTYLPAPAQPATERGAVAPSAVTVAGTEALTLRTTSVPASSSPVVVDVGSVVASRVDVYSTRPGGNASATAPVVEGSASVALAGVAGDVWTILLVDATSGAVVPLVVTWS